MISATTVLVAIVGSAIGGVVGSWLQIRHERQEGFRERMLQAADDAASSVGTALSATRVALADAEERARGERSLADAAPATDQARRSLDEAGDAAGRIDLLFGLDSGIGDALRTARGSLRRALAEAGATPPHVDRALAAFHEAEAAYAQFVHGARDAARSFGTSRLGRRRAGAR